MSHTTTLELDRPVNTEDELHAWIRQHLEINVPRKAVCAGHTAPFEYLRNAYFEPSREMIVWAPRGGGKTRLAAVATLLDLLHKPGIKVHILGGSMDQSRHVWNHLIDDLLKLKQIEKAPGGDRIRLGNGSVATILAQSQTNVRGQRMQKLRCDEVELFEPDILEAACLTTRSTRLTRKKPIEPGKAAAEGESSELLRVHGAVEMISTFHKTTGLMARLIDQAHERQRLVVQWCLMEVLEKCPEERSCTGCPLWEECRGKAKNECDGFFSIDDAIRMKCRVSEETWQSEILCRRPLRRGRVFPSFSRDIHVTDTCPVELAWNQPREVNLALDFGFAAPFVCLWVEQRGDVAHVVDEYLQCERTVDENMDAVAARAQWGPVKRVHCDPAGENRSEQTARSAMDVLRRRGYRVYQRRSHVVDGLELIRAALRPAHGPPRLFIHPRCKCLIAAMESYRYPDTGGESPLKDGTHDHPVDALRYWFLNRKTSRKVTSVMY